MIEFGLAPITNPVFGHTYPLSKFAFDAIKRTEEWTNHVAAKASIFSVVQIVEIKALVQFGNRENLQELVRSVLFIMLVDMDMHGADVSDIRCCNATFVAAAPNVPRYAQLWIPSSKSDPTGAFLKENRAVCVCPGLQFGSEVCSMKECPCGVLFRVNYVNYLGWCASSPEPGSTRAEPGSTRAEPDQPRVPGALIRIQALSDD